MAHLKISAGAGLIYSLLVFLVVQWNAVLR